MLTVACVLRTGGDFDIEYVDRLRDGVFQHLTGHRFVCLSDIDGPDHIKLGHDWPGWWAKMELFKLPPPVLYFDLDTMIVGDLSDIAAQAQQPCATMLRDFYRPNGLGSGMMGWGSDASALYHVFKFEPERFMQIEGGDQAFIELRTDIDRIARWQDVCPGQVVSYKADMRAGLSADARVVCFHGKPRPRDVNWSLPCPSNP